MLSLFLTSHSFAQINQNNLVSGKVSDSLGNPVSNASISIINQNTGEGLFFTQTDENGLYYFSISDPGIINIEWTIKASSIGYIISVKKINKIPSKIDFLLQADIQLLQEVIIKEDKPHIRKKGDTLNYKASDFSDKNDRVIGDIIKKLPGIEVSDNGLIKYNGKPINNFYIEGDNLLDDRYNIASRSIPAGIVDKVQIIENNQNIKMLNGIVISDRAALNIILKDKSKLNFVNTAKAGAGIKELYNFELNNMAFKSKFKAINSLKLNNVGTDLQEEVQSHNSDRFNTFEDDLTEILSLSPNTPPDIAKNRTLVNNSVLLSFNNFFKIKKDVSFRVNAFYLADKQLSEFTGNTKYYLPGGDTIGFTENEKSTDKIGNFFIQLNINKNSHTQYFNNTFSISNNKGNNNVLTLFNDKNIFQQLNNSLIQLSNTLRGVMLIKERNILEYNSYISIHKNPQAFTISPGLHEEILNNNIPFKETNQHANLLSFFTNNYISWRKISAFFFQDYKIGASYQNQTLNTNLDVVQSDNDINRVNDSFSNHLILRRFNLYANPEFRWEKEKNSISLSLPVNFLSLSYNDIFKQKDTSRNYFFVNPSLRWRYKVDKESETYVSYNFNTRTGDINQIYSGAVLLNYRNFNSNAGTIQQSQNNSIGAGLNFKRSLKILFFNLFFNYSVNENNYIYSYLIENDLIKRVGLPYKNENRSLMVNSDVSKYIFKLKTTLTLKYFFLYNSSNELQNNQLFPVTNLSNYYFIGIRPKIVEWLNANYEFEYINFVGKSNSSGHRYASHVGQFKQRLELGIYPLNQFAIKVKGEYYWNKSSVSATKPLAFADISVRYKLKKNPLELELLFSNLTDEKYYSIVSVNNNQFFAGTYRLRPRYVLITASYSF